VTSEQAKLVLRLYRSRRDLEDPELSAALAQADRDPELQKWFEQHCALQRKLRNQLANLPVPQNLREAIIAGRKVARPAVWQKPAWLAAAAMIAVLIGIGALWLRPDPFERFDLYHSRIVSTVWREYQMDIRTNDLGVIRMYLARNRAPADYVLPRGLERLSATGAGKLKWGNEPVSMVCFDRGDNQMMFLFVMNRHALKGEPGQKAEVSKVSQFQTVSWSDEINTYVLAGPEDPAFRSKYGPGQ
jgi:hypothetical protein